MRAARITLIVVLVLGVVFVGLDRVAVYVAQNKAAQQAQSSEGLTEKPKVGIKGFPFLTQALSRKLDHVTVSADGVAATSGGRSVQVEDFHADLYDVKLSNGYSRATADRATGTARIDYAELTKAAPAGITVSYPGGGATDTVRITGSYLGTHLSVLSKVSVVSASSGAAPNTIRLHAEGLPKAFTALGLEEKLRDQIDFTPELTHLPTGLGLSTVRTGPDGITVTFGGKSVVLAG
ncbi:LmeA family phospholipid-binding protein [Actinacidiphila sp. bgisy145]|uniref:LmeA family phospholipid-binding protein n=1 Tax=Actinacidiphila sp. bgisy145 TaxID=3413792 RepID=UPI003EBBC2D2